MRIGVMAAGSVGGYFGARLANAGHDVTFFARGAGPRMMNIVLSGTGGEAEAHFKVPSQRRVGADDLLLYSLEITGEAGYWIEFSRALIRGTVSPRTRAMSEVYPNAMEAAREKMHGGALASDVHKAAADVFSKAASMADCSRSSIDRNVTVRSRAARGRATLSRSSSASTASAFFA